MEPRPSRTPPDDAPADAGHAPGQAASRTPPNGARRAGDDAVRGAPPLVPGGTADLPARLTPFQHDVVELVDALAPGEVITYAEVAMELGRPAAAQAVAGVLRRVPGLPWWRVIPSDGRIYRTHLPTQGPLLAAEGIIVDADRRVHVPPGPDPR